MSKRPNRQTAATAFTPDQGRPAAAPPPVDQRPAESMDVAHRILVTEGLEEARGGRFAPDEAIEALFRKAGP